MSETTGPVRAATCSPSVSENNGLEPAATYFRMSSDRQETSIPAQREAVEAYARQHGYCIVRSYQDEGISGDATEKRLAFQRMLRDASETGDFSVVLCWDQDRFGRFDPLEAGYWIKPLRDAGVRLETVAQGRIDCNDFAGRIVYAVQQEGKHAFLVDLSRCSSRGMLAKARQGLWLGGPAPYGYRVRDQRLVVGDPAKAEVVRWLFRTYARGTASLGELARRLNERGVPGPGGKLWHKSSVAKILVRPCYKGDMAWNRRHDGKYHEVAPDGVRKAARRQKRRHDNPEDVWIVVEAAHEALIDRATWDKVQRALRERRDEKTPHHNGGDFLFTRLVRCGACGSPMHGCTNRKKDVDRKGRLRSSRIFTFRRYICGNYNAHGKAGGCVCNTIQEAQLLRAVLRRVGEDLQDEGNLARLRDVLRRKLEARRRSDPKQAQRLRDKIKTLSGQIDRGAEKLLTSPADLTAVLEDKLRDWQNQRRQAQAELKALESAATVATDLEVKLEQALACLRDLQAKAAGADRAKLRALIRQMVARIECHFTQVPYGKRTRSQLVNGMIYLRPDLLLHRDVLSGLARGIDGASHRAALEAGGRTLAVLAGGLSRIYPPEHTDLARQVEASGAVLTETSMDQEPLAGLFPVRNRIISGLSKIVVLVEAAQKSGALITASHAAEQGRTVMAVPGPVEAASSGGCHELIRKGAVLCRTVEDILEELHGVSAMAVAQRQAASAEPPPPPGPPPGLEDSQRRIWELLTEACHLDQLVQRSGLSVPQVSGALMMMEMRKIVRRLPGNRYERC